MNEVSEPTTILRAVQRHLAGHSDGSEKFGRGSCSSRAFPAAVAES